MKKPLHTSLATEDCAHLKWLPGGRSAWRGGAAMSALVLAAATAGCGGGDSSTPTLIAPTAPTAPAAPVEPVPPEAPQASAESRCNGFAGQTFGDATVAKATFVPTAGNVPEYCFIHGKMPKDLEFQLRMPSDWNRRTVFMGSGGFAGVIPNPQREGLTPHMPGRGYATIGSNHGHNGDPQNGSFALDEQLLNDYAYQAVPKVLGPAKAIMRARYGDAFLDTKMIYEGCSGGGRQALIQAQRFPDLFDGVIARAPANAFNPQFLSYQKVFKQLAQPGAALSPAKVKTIASAALAKCDALDGLADGIIARPDACNFDPVELACTGAESDACLTPAQVDSARTFYSPTSVANGRYTWPGFLPGGEDGGAFSAQTWGGTASRNLMEGYIKYMVAQDASVDPLQLDPAQYTARIDQLVSMIDAVDPDLGRFKALGGKVILWTGLSDWLITANNATDYYQRVVQKSGGQAAADEFVEYYTAPGVEHCALGKGADKVDLAGPMFDWLEKGIKPSASTIVATQLMTPPGTKPLSRPLCKYPLYAKYVSGDPNVSTSFNCTAP